jgi:cytochrome c biogenesis protein CcdA
MVSEVSSKASLLVREEIELAKAELRVKGGSLARGAAAGAVAAVFGLFTLIYLLHALAYFLGEVLFDEAIWAGYLVVTIILLVAGVIAAVLARRFIQSGTPPTPKMAIEEAKETRQMIDEARR